MQAGRVDGGKLDHPGAGAGLELEVVQAREIGNDAGKTGWEHGIGDVGDVRLAVDQQVVDAGAKGLLDLTGGSAEGDEV